MHDSLCFAAALTATTSVCASGVATTGPFSVRSVKIPGSPEGSITWQLFAELGPSDQLLGVSAGALALHFDSTQAILNDDSGAFAGLGVGDLPAGPPFMQPWDSYVTIGDRTFPSDVQLSPGFLGGDGVTPVIHGTTFTEPAGGGGWFDSNPGTADGLGGGLIMILTLPAQAEWSFDGELGYSDAETGSLKSAYIATILASPVPSPGTILFLALGSFTHTRRRRI